MALMRFKGITLSSIASVFCLAFLSLEVGQMKESGWGYFLDVWNAIDLGSAIMNIIF